MLLKQIFDLIVFIENRTSFGGYSKAGHNLKYDNNNNFQIHFNIIFSIYYYIGSELMLEANFSCLYTPCELSCATIFQAQELFSRTYA